LATRAKRAVLTRGEKVCAFIEKYCLTPEGKHIGKPMKLEDFQRKFILEIYDNPFKTHSAYLSIARKNGKTALIAAILLAHLAGPEAVRNSQIVSGAQSKDQAAVVFELAQKMVEMSPELSRLVRIKPSGKRLIGVARNVLYRALAAEGKTAHGLSPILAILDEVGQVVGPTDKFVTAITTAQGAYESPLLIAISTQAPTDADMFSTWIDAHKAAPDPRVVCHVYAAPEECDLDDKKAWAAANPALGKFRSIDDVEKQCKAAKEMPANEPEFRNLILNQRVEASSPFVAKSVWQENGAECGPIDGKKVWGGLDLSSVNDLTALVLVTEAGGVHCDFWLPATGLAEKSRKDRVPYDLWAKQGLLNTTPGRAMEYEFVAESLRGVFDRCDVQKIAFDRALFEHLKPWLVKANFSDEEIEKFIPYGQGTLSMTPALRELEVKLLGKQLKHGNHPILTMCAANSRVVGDSGARKFDKRHSRGRIDGMVALAMAAGVMPADEPNEIDSYYEFLRQGTKQTDQAKIETNEDDSDDNDGFYQ
jgi:phage terminase large subunit-like protein